jgi:isopentenyldiphosphate isomerase
MADVSPLSADELLDIVDEHDRVVGQAPRKEAYAHRLRHRCVFVLARDAQGRVFVHRRTARKLVFPSLYDMFVGGVVGTGESYDEAALREAKEELGVSGLPTPVPQAEEVAWHAFLTVEELEHRLVVHNSDGRIETEYTYQDDPFPPAG